MIQPSSGSVRRQIADTFRQRIFSGEIPPGSTLPGTRELAAAYGTSLSNAHAALAVLSREGLISRLPYYGTVVNARPRELKTVAVILFHDGVPHFSPYIERQANFMLRELKRRKIACRFFVEAEEKPDAPSLGPAIERREYDAALLLGASRRISPIIPRLKVPAIRCRGSYDQQDFMQQGLDQLKAMGCRSAGVLVSMRDDPYNPDDPDNNNFRTFDALRRHAEEIGLRLDASWIITPAERQYIGPHQFTAYAQSAFQSLWSQAERPEGLLVYPDELVPGLNDMLYKLRVRVPEDLKLVLHRNKEFHYQPPYPCAGLENSIRLAAAAQVDQLIELYQGRSAPPPALRYQPIFFNQ